MNRDDPAQTVCNRGGTEMNGTAPGGTGTPPG